VRIDAAFELKGRTHRPATRPISEDGGGCYQMDQVCAFPNLITTGRKTIGRTVKSPSTPLEVLSLTLTHAVVRSSLSGICGRFHWNALGSGQAASSRFPAWEHRPRSTPSRGWIFIIKCAASLELSSLAKCIRIHTHDQSLFSAAWPRSTCKIDSVESRSRYLRSGMTCSRRLPLTHASNFSGLLQRCSSGA